MRAMKKDNAHLRVYVKPSTTAIAIFSAGTLLLSNGDTFVVGNDGEGTDIQFTREYDDGFAWDTEE